MTRPPPTLLDLRLPLVNGTVSVLCDPSDADEPDAVDEQGTTRGRARQKIQAPGGQMTRASQRSDRRSISRYVTTPTPTQDRRSEGSVADVA